MKSGWETYRFDQIAVNVSDRVEPGDVDVEHYVGLEHLDPESLKIRRWGTPDDVEATKLRFRKGDIIFGRRRVYQRKLAVAEFDGICSAHAMVLRPKTDVVLPEFLPFFMQSDMFMNRALEISVGSLSPTINWRTLAKQEFALPPLEEQRRIAHVLWTVEQIRLQYQLAEYSARQLFHSAIAELAGNSESRSRLDSLSERITSGSRGWARYYAPSGTVFFRITNMKRSSIRPTWEDTKYVVAPETVEADRTRVEVGDILISVTAELGLVTLVDEDFPVANVNQHVALVRPNKAIVDSRFLAYFLASPTGLRQFQRFNDYGAKAGMNLKNVGRLPVPDLPLSEQRNAAKRLRELDDAWVSIQKRRMTCEQFQKGILSAIVGGGK